MSAPIGSRTTYHWRQSLILGIRSMINIDHYIYYWLYRIFNMLRIYRTIMSSHLIPYINSKINILTNVNICEPSNTSESYRKYNYKLFHPTRPGGKRWSEHCHPSNSHCSHWIILYHYYPIIMWYILHTNNIILYMLTVFSQFRQNLPDAIW